jgi:polysaccharide export outer membrane protein
MKNRLSNSIAILLAVSGTAIAAPTVASLTVTQPTAAASTVAAASPSTITPAAEPQQADLRLEALGMGDMVRVTVFRNPELTTEGRVSERGTILFPMIGEVNIAGLTPSQAGARIADKLRSGKYVVNPEVTVSMMQVNSRQVSVLGNVVKPGRYPLDSTTAHLTDVIALAGGVGPTGSDEVTIITNRGGKPEKVNVDMAEMFRRGDLTRNITLEPGDTIYVHKAPMVYVYGEVQKGGAYRVEPNMTVMQAIAMGGGITPRGTERGIKISRPRRLGREEGRCRPQHDRPGRRRDLHQREPVLNPLQARPNAPTKAS